MFGKMKIEYQKQAAVIFQRLDRWHRCIRTQPLPGVVLSYAIYPPTDVFEAPLAPMTSEAFDWTMSTLEKRIRSRCCGLLGFRYNRDKETLAGRSAPMESAQSITIDKVNRNVVTYLHRTVAEFIATAEVWQEVCELTKDMTLDSTSSLASVCLSTMKLANQLNDDGLKWYLEAAARFCRQATTTEPQVIQKYVYEMDRIMSELQKKSRNACDHKSHDSTLHWSAKSHCVELDALALAVEKHESIHTFAARRGILAHLRLLPSNIDHDERFVIVLNALFIWKYRLVRAEHTYMSLDMASAMFSYLLRYVTHPEWVAFDTSLWQQVLLLCTDMRAENFSILEAARLLKILLSAVGSPQPLWQGSVQAWQNFIIGPTHVLESFRAYTNAKPSQESIVLLHDLERFIGTKDNRSINAGANRKGSNSQTNRRNEKKPRRNHEETTKKQEDQTGSDK
jgi:hypothetical protein